MPISVIGYQTRPPPSKPRLTLPHRPHAACLGTAAHHGPSHGRGRSTRRTLGPLDVGAHVDASEHRLVARAVARHVALEGVRHGALERRAQRAVVRAAVGGVLEALAPATGYVGHGTAVRRASATKRLHKQRAQGRQAARDDAHRALD